MSENFNGTFRKQHFGVKNRMGKQENKKRIDTSGEKKPLSSPFESLYLGQLPEFNEAINSFPEPEKKIVKKGRVVLRKETSQRAGKAVIVISHFESRINLREIDELARELKKFCGCGGTVKGREIEIQGDQPQRIRSFLEAKGFRVDGVR